MTQIFSGGFHPMEKIITGNTELADPCSAFVEIVRENGIEINDRFAPDGTIQRFPASDSKRGELDGWAVLHLDGPVPVGVFGSFKGGGWDQKWVADIGREMSFIEKAKTDQWLSELRRKRDEAKKIANADAARRAEDEVGSLADASNDHPYLVRKQVKSYGLKVDSAGRIVIPLINSDGEIQSYQRISHDGQKRFLKNGKIDGGFFEIRGSRNSVYVCEGYATGASVFEATGCTIMVAFNAGNLVSVSKLAREMFPAAKMYIAADNDQFTDGNPGMAKAKLAAHEARAEVVYPVFRDEFLAEKPTDFNDLHVKCGIEEVKKYLGFHFESRHRAKFEFSRVDSLEIRETQYIIGGHLEADSLNLIFGEPGCGKSFISIDMACCVATGTPWHGHEVQKGLVIYIAGEGHNGLAKRFRAWSMAHGKSLDGAPLYKSKKAAQLYDVSVAIDVADAVREIVEQAGVEPSMIIIDTVARNMGGDENSTQDMNQFIENIDSLLRVPYQCAVLLVHHSGKASPGQARGSTALRGALDAEYQVEMDGTSKMIKMENRKMKDGEVPAPKSFSIKQVGLGVYGADGSEIVGAALETVDISGLVGVVKEKSITLTKNQGIAFNTLCSLVKMREIEPVSVPITTDDWRDACHENGLERNRFREAKDALAAKKVVSISSIGIVSLIDEQQ